LSPFIQSYALLKPKPILFKPGNEFMKEVNESNPVINSSRKLLKMRKFKINR